MKARVTVQPRPEILDPQGKAIHAALGRLGLTEVVDVRAGKSFELEVDAESPKAAKEILDQVCQKLLANPLIETYTYELEGA